MPAADRETDENAVILNFNIIKTMSATFLKSSCQDFNPTEWIMLFLYSVLFQQITLPPPLPMISFALSTTTKLLTECNSMNYPCF